MRKQNVWEIYARSVNDRLIVLGNISNLKIPNKLLIKN